MGFMNLSLRNDREIMAELGQRLRALRERTGQTAIAAAAATGLSRRTVWRAESGDNPTLLTLLRLLRLYGALDQLELFLRAPEISPMSLIAKGSRRKGTRRDG
jgi:transcriptional regulator with XRE-family HTH domain